MAHPNHLKSIPQRFEEKYEPEPNSGCWLWTASTDTVGYGHMWVGGKLKQANRISWELYIGPIPEDKYVLHKCDVRSCVNPYHLFLGTQRENVEDMHKKGRARYQSAKYMAFPHLPQRHCL